MIKRLSNTCITTVSVQCVIVYLFLNNISQYLLVKAMHINDFKRYHYVMTLLVDFFGKK